jgi:uncharacterized membrane protein
MNPDTKLKNLTAEIATIIVCFLFFLLPFSSWIVSLSGNSYISLFRDALVCLLFAVSVISLVLFKGKINNKPAVAVASILLIWGLASFFWREASTLQWMRGIRFTFVPLLLFLSLSAFNFSERQRNKIYWSILISAFIIVIFSAMEFFGIKIPLTTDLSKEGALFSVHAVSGKITRLQAVLAGPNALGLYMMALIALACGSFSKINRKFVWLIPIFSIILFETYSRSSLIGLVFILLPYCFLFLSKKFGTRQALGWAATFLLLLTLCTFYISKIDRFQVFFTHGASSSLRYEQIERLWNSRSEIGLLGKGSGTAGPSSQNRLDGGPNNWSENIYLEVFEELGLVGMLLFITLVILLLKNSWENHEEKEGLTAFLALLGFAIAGLFINIYTGQVGIYLLFLVSGLLLQNKEGKYR